MSAATFPFGVAAEPGDEPGDRRGPDTMNRVLLHAARHHDRREVFLDWEKGRKGWAWLGTPDWRADRNTIRVALVLRERLEVARQDTVALWLPLCREFAWIERACWSVGAVSVPVWPEWGLDRVARVLADARPQVLFAPDPGSLEALRVTGGLPESVRASIVMGGAAEETEDALPYPRFMDYGSVLDTPERASMWRTSAREAGPDDPVCREYAESERGQEMDHDAFVRAAATLLQRFPPERGRVWAVAEGRPDFLLRAAVYAGWAGGLTRVAFAAPEEARARLGELRPSLALGPAGLAEPLASAVEEAGPEPAREPERPGLAGLLGRLFGSARNGNGGVPRGNGAGGGGAAGSTPLYYVATDRSEVEPDLAERARGVRFVARAELGVPTGAPAARA